jgi:hypothetical protein
VLTFSGKCVDLNLFADDKNMTKVFRNRLMECGLWQSRLICRQALSQSESESQKFQNGLNIVCREYQSTQ